jgi:DNA-binding NtrC family response regulator
MRSSPALVLVVDDDRLFRKTLGILLGQVGLEHRMAASAEEAIPILDHADLAVVIADLNLGPGADGVAVLEGARARAPHAARALITGDPRPSIDELVARGLVERIWPKPLEPDALLAWAEDRARACWRAERAERATPRG